MKNNKGYMLVEIILASAIAFGLAFFIIDLIIKLKNKNDDLFIETLVNTDKTIISNKLMDYAIKEGDNFDCSKLVIEGNTIKYNGEQIDIVNKYTTVKEIENYCNKDGGLITINIPLEVKQMPDKEFDITLDYKYQIGDMVSPTCTMSVSGTTITVSASDEGSGIKCSGWDSDCSTSLSGSSVSTTKSITGVGDYVFSMKDKANNSGSCSIEVRATTTSKGCPEGYSSNTAYTTCWKYDGPSSFASCYDPGTYLFGYEESYCNAMCNGGCTYSYYCNGNLTSSSSCYSYASMVTNYTCSSGYTKISDSYCYKKN